MSIENKVREIVVSKEEIATRVAELGKVISIV